MRSNAQKVVPFVPRTEQQPVKYGIRHESGAWYNHRRYSEVTGPLVADPDLALTWESKALAQETATMLSRGNRGLYEVVPMPVPAELATWADR